MDIEAFNRLVVGDWNQRSPSPREVSIPDLQDIAHFYFGNPDLGVLHLASQYERISYEYSFSGLARTPFSIVAARRYNLWLHLGLVHVHTAFTGGLPASVGISDLRDMRDFAALVYTHATRDPHYFAAAGVYALSHDAIIVSLGYTLVEYSPNKSLTTVRGFMIDYLHPLTEPTDAAATIRRFHCDMPQT